MHSKLFAEINNEMNVKSVNAWKYMFIFHEAGGILEDYCVVSLM